MIGAMLALAILGQSGTGLSLADIPAYRDALAGFDETTPRPVSFRDLWDHPDAYRGHRVQVIGRVARRFRAEASGELPPRREWWLATESGDLLCVVTPDRGDGIPDGARVSVDGTSLGLIRYASGDVTRMAPLIVGPVPPVMETATASPASDWRAAEWVVGVLAAMIVLLVLARSFARRPPPARRDAGPPVEFES